MTSSAVSIWSNCTALVPVPSSQNTFMEGSKLISAIQQISTCLPHDKKAIFGSVDLSNKSICPMLPLLSITKTVDPFAQFFDKILLSLPPQFEHLDEALFPVQRQIESQYRSLPWPDQTKRVVVLTEILGGHGDVVAAAKAITVMQKLCPQLTFDWVLEGHYRFDPRLFLHDDSSKVYIRNRWQEPLDKKPADLLLTGPVRLSMGPSYIESLISRKISGPTFSFVENGEYVPAFYPDYPKYAMKAASHATTSKEIYQTIHPEIFSVPWNTGIGSLPMGLQPGTGVFLDQSRIQASLSRGYCDPSYLSQIQDVDLRQAILAAMDVFDGRSVPNYDQYSFNSGYAHHPVSWGKFIDCVAIHEKMKNVVIVLNQNGAFDRLSNEAFQGQIFTPERLTFLRQKGYGIIRLKGKNFTVSLSPDGEKPASRCLTVIVRPSFDPNDMRCLQLASERLLATGDNSAAEAWAARCKLYLYEDVANAGCKWRFLQQQVDLAGMISPNLGRLLALFGGDSRLPDPFLNQPLSRKKMNELEQLLNDPNLSDATIQFCNHIIAHYSFDKVLEAALKRSVWHHHIPTLAQVEAEALGEGFRNGFVAYLKNPVASPLALPMRNIYELGSKVRETIQREMR